MHRACLAVVSLLFLSCSESPFKPVTKGLSSYEIRPEDTSGSPLTARVYIVDPKSWTLYAQVTAKAAARVRLPDPGPWWIAAAKTGYQSHVDTAVVLDPQTPHVLRLELEAQDVEQETSEWEPRAKPAGIGIPRLRLLGDLNHDGEIDEDDVVSMFRVFIGDRIMGLDRYIGDIDQNNRIDWTDVMLLGQFVYANGASGYGIGDGITPPSTAYLSPDPQTVDFFNQGHQWHSFYIRANVDSVTVRVNPSGQITEPILEVAGGRLSPKLNYCGGEFDDEKVRKNGWKVHLAGCETGTGQVILLDRETGFELASYEINIQGVEIVEGEGEVD